MKTLLRTRGYLLLIPLLLVCGLVISYGQKQAGGKKMGRVEKCPKLGAKVHPPVNLTPDDEKELKEKLAKFDGSLYRLEALKAGKVDQERSVGTLKLSKALRADMAIAQKQGFDVFGPEFVPCSMVAAAPLFTKEKQEEAKKMMDAISPILSKYEVSQEKR
jgi:hypothetical protein